MLRLSSRRLASHLETIRLQQLFLHPSSSFATTTTPSTGGADHDSTLNQPSSSSPPPIRVGFTGMAGRGVFSTRSIRTGELIHTAKPVVCHPNLSSLDSACYFCLKKLPTNNNRNNGDGLSRTDDEDFVTFCSNECKNQSAGFRKVEKKADWSSFTDYCNCQCHSLDILQPATLTSEMMLLVDEEFSLIRSTLQDADIPTEQLAFMTKQWYAGVLARIRINAFRVEMACGSYEDLLSSAAASVEVDAAVGNAVYMLPSFYNHDCDPNAHILWLHNVDAELKALRDIEPGEELRICYIDASMDHEARKAILYNGFGFNCNCFRCSSGY